MKNLEFHYGTMASSKSANLLMQAKNYEIQGKRVLLLKPSEDTRDRLIKSRAIENGMYAYPVSANENLFDLIKEMQSNCTERIHCVFIDEAQFLTLEQVIDLGRVADELDILVMAYGLLKTYIDNNLFEGSQALLYQADVLKEIATVCYFCDKKATMNLRLVDNKPQYSGEEIIIGDIKAGRERYLPTCRHHYYEPPVDQDCSED